MTDEATGRPTVAHPVANPTEAASPGEHLSALLDGELPPEQTDFLLKRVRGDAELRGTLQRYQLIGDTLRGERARARPDFMLRVSAAVAAEPPLPAPVAARAGRATTLRWLRPVAGLAVAASVASIAVVVMQRDPTAPAPAVVAGTVVPMAAPPAAAPAPLSPAPSPLVASTSLTGEPASYVTPPVARGVGVIPPAQLASYVVAHSEFSSPLGRRNVLTGLVVEEPPPTPPAPPRQQAQAPAPSAR